MPIKKPEQKKHSQKKIKLKEKKKDNIFLRSLTLFIF
jgi:hypothetical protein